MRRLIAGQIQCPFHGACFDVRSGVALSGPAVAPLQGIPVKIEHGRVLFGGIANCPPLSTAPDVNGRSGW